HVYAVLDAVLVQVPQAFDVLLELLRLRIRDEHDAVRAAQHQLPRRVVVDLPGNRVELETGPVPRDRSEVQRKEVEEQRTVRLRGQRHHLPPPRGGRRRVHVLQVRRLAGPPRAVVDDLAGDLPRGMADQRHQPPSSGCCGAKTRSNPASSSPSNAFALTGGSTSANSGSRRISPAKRWKNSSTNPSVECSSKIATRISSSDGVTNGARKSCRFRPAWCRYCQWPAPVRSARTRADAFAAAASAATFITW